MILTISFLVFEGNFAFHNFQFLKAFPPFTTQEENGFEEKKEISNASVGKARKNTSFWIPLLSLLVTDHKKFGRESGHPA